MMRNKNLSLLQKVLGKTESGIYPIRRKIEEAKVNVTIKIEDNGVKLIRKGDINMNLHFVEGEETTTLYDTPAGRIP